MFESLSSTLGSICAGFAGARELGRGREVCQQVCTFALQPLVEALAPRHKQHIPRKDTMTYMDQCFVAGVV